MTPDRENVDVDAGHKPFNAWLMIALFAVLLLAPVAAQLLGVGVESQENRTLAPFPSLTRAKEIKDLPRMADDFVNDRFGLRSQLVHANSSLRYLLGVSSSKDVVVGEGGWLFYTAHRIMEQHTGADLFTPGELDRWVLQMKRNRDLLAERGIELIIMGAPEKNTIYPEKLRDYPRPPGAVTRFDQLAARLRATDLEFIDPRAALTEAKERGEQVYFEGDTHWTQRGAYIAYTLLMDRVRKRFPEIVPLTLDDYKISFSAPPAADLARLLMLERDIKYTVENFTLREPSRQVGTDITSRPKWPWRVVEVRNLLADRPHVVIMGDSFTDYVLGPTFLYETFRNPILTNHNLGTFNFGLLEETNPQIVIYQFAERYLHYPIGAPVGLK